MLAQRHGIDSVADPRAACASVAATGEVAAAASSMEQFDSRSRNSQSKFLNGSSGAETLPTPPGGQKRTPTKLGPVIDGAGNPIRTLKYESPDAKAASTARGPHGARVGEGVAPAKGLPEGTAEFLVVIPARRQSSRLPGKPLIDLLGYVAANTVLPSRPSPWIQI